MRQNESLWIGVGVGCSLLLLCGLCILGAGVFHFAQSADALPPPTVSAPPPPWPLPTAPPPTPSPPPTAPMVAPATPTGPGGGTDPRQVRATVTEVQGLASIAVGAACTADITRHDREDGTFWCNAQVRCGGVLLYGGGDAGYFDCILYAPPARDVVGADVATTLEDRDAALSLNTVGGTLEVRDDASGTQGAFRVLARVEGVQ